MRFDIMQHTTPYHVLEWDNDKDAMLLNSYILYEL